MYLHQKICVLFSSQSKAGSSTALLYSGSNDIEANHLFDISNVYRRVYARAHDVVAGSHNLPEVYGF